MLALNSLEPRQDHINAALKTPKKFTNGQIGGLKTQPLLVSVMTSTRKRLTQCINSKGLT